jgi:hypothetical protein
MVSETIRVDEAFEDPANRTRRFEWFDWFETSETSNENDQTHLMRFIMVS